MNNIGRLSTPNNAGANIEVYEDGTCKLTGIITEDLILSHGRFKNKISNSSGLKEFQMLTGETYNDGAWFSLRTQDEVNGENIGSFNLGVRNIFTDESIALKGFPNQVLRWGNWDVECANLHVDNNGIYKIYKNNLIEQYGFFSVSGLSAATSVAVNITLPKTMTSTNYIAFIQINGVCNNWANIVSTINSKSTSYLNVLVRNNGSTNISETLVYNYYVFGF